MNEVINGKLNEIDSLLEMIEFLFKSADQEKLQGILPLAGITLTLTQMRAKVFEIARTDAKVHQLLPQALSSEIKKEKVDLKTTVESKVDLVDENLADFVKGLSSTLSKRIQMLPIEETEKTAPARQGRIRQLLNKEQSQVNEDTASE